MQLTPTITIAHYSSIQELAATPYPVLACSDRHRACIDISVGLRHIEVHSALPLEGWRQIMDEDTRFEICPGTTGEQIASALLDPTVVTAIEQVITPPHMNWKISKSDAAKLSGMESFNTAVANLIAALGAHMTVYRTPPMPTSPTGQGLLI